MLSSHFLDSRCYCLNRLHWIYGNALAKNACPGGHEIYNFGTPFLGNDNYIPVLSFSEPCPSL